MQEWGLYHGQYKGGEFIYVGDVVAQWLVRRTLDHEVASSSPGKTLNSHSASLHPGV